MKKLMTKCLAVVMALSLCISLLPVNAFAAEAEPAPGDAIGNCKYCNGPTYYSGFHDANGYGVYCGNCGGNYQVPTPGTYQPSEPTTGNFCPNCGKETYVLVDGNDVYCNQNYCRSCGYEAKSTHYFGPDDDSAACMNGCGYQNPNYVPLPEGVIQAECGGTFMYDEATGSAVGITKGTGCVDVKNHDHQCDYCHAEMFVGEWETVEEPTCTKAGREVFVCTYEGCNEQRGDRPINALGHDFENQSWDGGKPVTNAAAGNYKGKDGKTFTFDPNKALLYKYTRPCVRKDATEEAYGAVPKGTQPIHVEYVLDEAYNGMPANTVIWSQNDVAKLKPGETTTIKPDRVPDGYELYDDSAAYAAGQTVPYTDAPSQTVQFRIKPIYCQWQIKYVYANGGKAAEDGWINFTMADLGKVSKDSPVINGYTPDQVSVGPKSQGDMVNKVDNNAIIVTYSKKNSQPVNVEYVLENGTKVGDGASTSVREGDSVNVKATQVPEGYELVNDDDKTVGTTVNYTGTIAQTVQFVVQARSYTLTIKHVGADGAAFAGIDPSTETSLVAYGTAIPNPAKTVTGYTSEVVSGWEAGKTMPAGNHEIVVKYTANQYTWIVNYAFANDAATAAADKTGVTLPANTSDPFTIETIDALNAKTVNNAGIFKPSATSVAVPEPTWNEGAANRTFTTTVYFSVMNSRNVEYRAVDENGNVIVPTTQTGELVYQEGNPVPVNAPELPDGYELVPNEQSTKNATYDEPLVTFTVRARSYTLTINYVDTQGNSLRAAYSGTVAFGDTYSVDSLPVAGYHLVDAAQATVSGTMRAENLVVDVVYAEDIPDVYWLTVRYVDEDGYTVAPSYLGSYNEGDAYSVTSPVVDGYTTSQTLVTGTMPGNDDVVIVVYRANGPVDVEIEEPDTPLGELPEEPETDPDPEPEPEPEPEPDVEIEEPDTPLAELPEEVEIDVPGVPLADVPRTGDNSYIWGVTALLSGTGLAWLTLKDRKRKVDAE